MYKLDWGAIRAYASLLILTIVAVYAVWKDADDYKQRAWKDRGTGLRWFLKRHAVEVLYVVTLLSAFVGAMEIHATRHSALQDKADAQAQNAASTKQIESLKTEVIAGNDLLTKQREDFLRQFTEMSKRVADLQASVKTADLQLEAAQLRKDLETTRKSMEVPKATLSLVFARSEAESLKTIILPIENGIVKVPFSVVNETDADALEGGITLRACDGCKIVGNPENFTKLSGEPDNERSFDFQHVFANSRLPKAEVSITPPAGATSFVLGIVYRCRTCVLVKPSQALPENDMGLVLIAPQ